MMLALLLVAQPSLFPESALALRLEMPAIRGRAACIAEFDCAHQRGLPGWACLAHCLEREADDQAIALDVFSQVLAATESHLAACREDLVGAPPDIMAPSEVLAPDSLYYLLWGAGGAVVGATIALLTLTLSR